MQDQWAKKMGNSLEQYRAAIGKWLLGRTQRIRNQSLPAIDQHTDICTNTCKNYPIRLLSVIAIILFSLVIALVYKISKFQPYITELDSVYTSCTNISSKEITLSDLAAATGGIVPFQCHRALLVIAGVEQNPGPSTDAIDTARKQENIIAELSTDAPNTEICDCLRSYNPNNNIRQHKREFGKSEKPVIVSTLEFLGLTGQDQFTKNACINTLICRIQNLFPDVCNLCKAEYCVKRDDVSLLSCVLCGQGSHNICIREHLGLQEDQLLDPKTAAEKLNPTNFSEFYYLCGACQEEIIPDKEAGLLKKRSTIVTDSENETSVGQQTPVENQSETNTEENRENDEDEVVTEIPTHLLVAVSTEDLTQLRQESSENTQNQQTQNNRDVQRQQDTVGNQDQAQSHPQHQSNQTTTICPFYKKGTCRFGVTGRGCPKNHPKPCKKLLQHGNKAPNGCTLGRANCDKFHPKMCHTSFTKGECFNNNCQSRHVNGTKRIQMDEKIVGQIRMNKDSKDTTTKKAGKRTTDSGDFLGVLHTLKVEMLEAMDTKIAQYMSVQTSHQTGNQLRTATPMMKLAEPATYMNHGLQGPLHSMNMQSGQPWGMTVPGQPVYLPAGMNQMAPMIIPMRPGNLNY